MTPARFKELVALTRMGKPGYKGKGLTLKALRIHLVDGVPVPVAASRAGITSQALYQSLKRLPRETCPHCGQVIPKEK